MRDVDGVVIDACTSADVLPSRKRPVPDIADSPVAISVANVVPRTVPFVEPEPLLKPGPLNIWEQEAFNDRVHEKYQHEKVARSCRSDCDFEIGDPLSVLSREYHTEIPCCYHGKSRYRTKILIQFTDGVIADVYESIVKRRAVAALPDTIVREVPKLVPFCSCQRLPRSQYAIVERFVFKCSCLKCNVRLLAIVIDNCMLASGCRLIFRLYATHHLSPGVGSHS